MARVYLASLIAVILFSLGPTVAFAQKSPPAEAGASEAHSSFMRCVQELAAQARAKGISSEVIQLHLDGLPPDLDILAGASSQPEFIKPIWDYLDATAPRRASTRAGASLPNGPKFSRRSSGPTA